MNNSNKNIPMTIILHYIKALIAIKWVYINLLPFLRSLSVILKTEAIYPCKKVFKSSKMGKMPIKYVRLATQSLSLNNFGQSLSSLQEKATIHDKV
jgi:uncharacterized membrane protein SpoIIM required for sporulation